VVVTVNWWRHCSPAAAAACEGGPCSAERAGWAGDGGATHAAAVIITVATNERPALEMRADDVRMPDQVCCQDRGQDGVGCVWAIGILLPMRAVTKFY
jgi:hypothetical protein